MPAPAGAARARDCSIDVRSPHPWVTRQHSHRAFLAKAETLPAMSGKSAGEILRQLARERRIAPAQLDDEIAPVLRRRQLVAAGDPCCNSITARRCNLSPDLNGMRHLRRRPPYL